MEIKKIYVDGYKNIGNAEIELNDITSILSVNNYGKSNLLLGMVFGLNFMQVPFKTKEYMMCDIKCIPSLKSNKGKNFKFAVECSTVFEKKDVDVLYVYEFKWASMKHPNIVKEELKIKEKDSSSYTTYISRNMSVANYKASREARCSSDIQIEYSNLVLNKLVNYDKLFYAPILKELLNINMYIDRHFDANIGYGITFMTEQELTNLTLRPENNIPKTLYRIKQDHPQKYTMLVNAYKDLFPSVEELYVDELSNQVNHQFTIVNERGEYETPKFSDKIYVLYVKDKNLIDAINFNAMSDGAKRILLLLTFVVLAQINKYSIICIEEPENSINPNLLKKFLIALDALKDDLKLIFSSHSPYIINYMEPTKLYLGIPNENGVATFKKIKTNTNNLKRLNRSIQESDMRLGDYLFDLMSGDIDDIKELISYVE